jgi:predicted Zn-dependent protease
MKLSCRIENLFAAGVLAAAIFASFQAPLPASAQATRADAQKDPVLNAMLEELDRSMAHLQLPGFEKPYFIEYRIEDVNDYETRAVFGASEGSQHSHVRIARINVRVGDYKTDNSGPRGDGDLQLASIDDDPIALRSALWTGTDQAYKGALAAYAQKQAELKQVQTPPQADDFSKVKPIISLAEPLKFSLNESEWTDRVARDSGIYRNDPALAAVQHNIQYSTAAFHARVTTTWIVSSEGAVVRKSASSYSESFGVGTQADDGMRLDRSYGTSGNALGDLDNADEFKKHVVTLISTLRDLRNAPLVDDEYHGPVLMSADASADTLHSLLAAGVTATRPKLGTEARTNGPFASSYHARIMPEFLTVIDDPTLKTWEGKDLVGAYSVDDEAVPAQTVKLVADGHLENYLIGRTPIRDFPESNGHARAGVTGPPHPVIGVLKVTAQQGLSDEELNRKLLELGKDRGLKSVYFIETLGAEATPRLLYRTDMDGKRTLVRGAVLEDLDQRALRAGVEAAGKNLWVANYASDIPETVLAPALLFDDVTVKRANETNDKLPYYPPPE